MKIKIDISIAAGLSRSRHCSFQFDEWNEGSKMFLNTLKSHFVLGKDTAWVNVYADDILQPLLSGQLGIADGYEFLLEF